MLCHAEESSPILDPSSPLRMTPQLGLDVTKHLPLLYFRHVLHSHITRRFPSPVGFLAHDLWRTLHSLWHRNHRRTGTSRIYRRDVSHSPWSFALRGGMENEKMVSITFYSAPDTTLPEVLLLFAQDEQESLDVFLRGFRDTFARRSEQLSKMRQSSMRQRHENHHVTVLA